MGQRKDLKKGRTSRKVPGGGDGGLWKLKESCFKKKNRKK